MAGVLIAAGHAAAAPATPRGVVYGGETSLGEVVTLEVNPAATQVRNLRYSWTAECVLGPAATPTTAPATGWTEYRGPFAINRRGAWTKTLVVNSSEGSIRQVFRYRFVGRRAGGTMRGTLNATLTETDTAGQLVRTCTAPPSTFTIREVHVFGGLTTVTRDPIVAVMNPARTVVTRLRWDWRGSCVAGPAATPETQLDVTWRDFLSGVAVDRTGRFGFTGQLGPENVPELGLTRNYLYKAVGRRVGQTIKGSITSSFIETDALTGGVIRECASAGPVKFQLKN